MKILNYLYIISFHFNLILSFTNCMCFSHFILVFLFLFSFIFISVLVIQLKPVLIHFQGNIATLSFFYLIFIFYFN